MRSAETNPGGTAKSPAASAVLDILKFLAKQQRPASATAIMQALGLPRSTTYQLLGILAESGFVMHLRNERRYSLGFTAFEVGAGFGYQQPLARIGRALLAPLVARVGQTAHISVLHGRDSLYVVEERAPRRPPLVTDEGVTLPAHLTASGRVILAALPPQQVRALYPNSTAFATLQGTGPDSPTALRRVLDEVRRLGYGFVDDDVTPGVSSVAQGIYDPGGMPIAALAVTYYADQIGSPGQITKEEIIAQVTRTASELQRRLTGRPQVPHAADLERTEWAKRPRRAARIDQP